MRVLKSYGTSGGVIISTSDGPKDINLNEPVFISFDELPVPFFIEEWEEKGTGRVFVKFEDIDSLESAEDLVGKEISIDKADDVEGASLQGYTLFDVSGEEIGPVIDFCDYPGNPCIEVNYEGEDVLVPFHEDLIDTIDSKRKTIVMTLPEGLFE